MAVVPDKKLVSQSQFGNTYGALSLFKGSDGQHYLRLDDCSGSTYWGPLTKPQLDAYPCAEGCPYLHRGKLKG